LRHQPAINKVIYRQSTQVAFVERPLIELECEMTAISTTPPPLRLPNQDVTSTPTLLLYQPLHSSQTCMLSSIFSPSFPS
jgi:hypothetical protein